MKYLPSVCCIWPGLLWQCAFQGGALCQAVGLCHPGNQSCSQLLLLLSLVNAPESLRHISLAESLSGWSWDSDNTSQNHDKLVLPLDIERYSSSLKCFKSSWQPFIVPQAYYNPACFPQDPRKSSSWCTRQDQRDHKH